MATVQDVYRFEEGIGDSRRLLTEGAAALDDINAHIEAVESAMMEEFGCDQQGLKALSKKAELGPKAATALSMAKRACFSDPWNAMKATALRWQDAIDDWLKEARGKKATHIVVGNDSFDYEDYPIYVNSAEEAKKEEQRLNVTAGVYYVTTIRVTTNNKEKENE